MQISATGQMVSNTSFKNLYITTATPNLASKVQKTANEYTKNYFPEVSENSRKIFEELKTEMNLKPTDKINKFEDLQKVDVFVLAAGKGSRFAKMCDAIEAQNGEKNNKITIPFNTKSGEFHLLDTGLALGTPFADKEKGVEIINADEARGSFHDVYTHYQNNPAKDFVILSGDCIYGEGADLKSMMRYIISSANNRDKKLGLFCAEMTPERAAGRAAVATIDRKTFDKENGTFSVSELKEKPPLDYAIEHSSKDPKTGELVTYGTAGGFYSSADTLVKVLSELEKNPDLIKKNDKEIHDFAIYADETVKNADKWFNAPKGKSTDTKVVGFYDVGNPSSYIDVLQEIQSGKNSKIQNLPQRIQTSLTEALQGRLVKIDGTRTIDVSGKYNKIEEGNTGLPVYDEITDETINVIA